MYQLVRKFQGEVRALVSDADVVGVAFVPIAESGPCIGCRARLNSHDICAFSFTNLPLISFTTDKLKITDNRQSSNIGSEG